MQSIKKSYYMMGVSMTMGVMSLTPSIAHATTELKAQDITNNLADSIGNLPRLVSGIAFLAGIVLALLGVLKIKDHVENPSQTPLKDGAMRLAVGGALSSAPAVFTALSDVFGSGSNPDFSSISDLSFSG